MIKSFKTPLFSGVFHLPTWLISPPSTLSVVHGPPGSRYLDHHHNHEDIYIMMERLSVTFLLVLPSPANFFLKKLCFYLFLLLFYFCCYFLILFKTFYFFNSLINFFVSMMMTRLFLISYFSRYIFVISYLFTLRPVVYWCSRYGLLSCCSSTWTRRSFSSPWEKNF